MTEIKYKCVFVIIDGLGDLPIAKFEQRTPLEAAATPVLDRLAAAGTHGLVDPILPGVTANTHSGGGLLLGLSPPDVDKLNRGPVEAAGAGHDLQSGDVALRFNFATVKYAFGGFVVMDRRAGRITDGTKALAAELDNLDLGDGVTARIKSTDEHRGVLVLSGDGLSAAISDTDPGDGEMPAPVLKCQALSNEARRTAERVNDFIKQAHGILQAHPLNVLRAAKGMFPANGVLTRGAGSHVPLQNVVRQLGISTALVSACNTIQGLGRLFGYEIITDARFTGGTDTDIEAKIQAALGALNQHDLVYIHIKAPDVCSHDRRPSQKLDFLQRLDAALAPLLEQQIIIAVAADHSTDSNTGMHTSDPVPALFYSPDHGPGILGVNFGEEACRNGTMERQTSSAFLQKILEAMQAAVT